MGPHFKLCNLVLRKDAVLMILTSLWKVANQQLDKKLKKQANNARRTVGKLLGHFSGKIRFVFRSKTFPKKSTLMQECSNA